MNWRYLLMIALMMASCRVEHEEVSREEAIRYYLNHQNYDQAIALLLEKLAETPDDHSAKILLSSAYSGSVGLNTIDAFYLLEPYFFNDIPKNDAASSRQSASENPIGDEISMDTDPADQEAKRKAILTFSQNLRSFAAQMQEAMNLAFRLPHTTTRNRDRLILSLSILATIPSSAKEYKPARTYMAILAFVQFMNYLRDAIPIDREASDRDAPWYQALWCRLDLGILLPNLSRSADFLALSLQAFAEAANTKDSAMRRNLESAKTKLIKINRLYLQYPDVVELVNWSIHANQVGFCD